MLAGFSSSAAAEPGLLAVRAKGLEKERATAVAAVTGALKGAGWTLALRTFTAPEGEALVECLPTDQPWPCLSKATGDAKVRRLAVLSLASQPTANGVPMVVVTVQIASADQPDTAHGARRFCQPCSPDSLFELTTAAAEEVLSRMYLRSSKTFLEVKSRPLGAVVAVDGKRLGVTDAAFPILPGAHRVVVTHPQYPAETRTIEAKADKTTVVTVVFGPNPVAGGLVDPARAGEFQESGASPLRLPLARRPQEQRRSVVLPAMLVAAGGVALAWGIVAIAIDEDAPGRAPNPRDPQSEGYSNTAPLGVGLLIGGALVGGAGGWLWWRNSKSSAPRRSPSTSLMVHPGGAAFSFSKAF